MLRARWGACGVLAAIALVAGMVASAQQPGAPASAQDPNRITVTKRPYDLQKLVSAPAVADDVYRGRTVWLQRCAYCHDGVGQPSYNTLGPWIDAERVQLLTDVAVKAIIAAGTERMPGFSYALNPQQVNDLLAFLKTVPASAKPTPNQLAGKAPANVSGD